MDLGKFEGVFLRVRFPLLEFEILGRSLLHGEAFQESFLSTYLLGRFLSGKRKLNLHVWQGLLKLLQVEVGGVVCDAQMMSALFLLIVSEKGKPCW